MRTLPLLLVPLVIACGRGAPDPQDGPVIASEEADPALPGVTELPQGWTEATQLAFSFTDEGSQILPYAWFLALEQPGLGGRFRDDAHLARLGLIPTEASAPNPDALPIGLTRHTDPAGAESLGINCAACHTALLRYQGKAVRIDGGQGRFNLNAFLAELQAALTETLSDPARFDRFAAAVLQDKAGDEAARGSLKGALEVQTAAFETRAKYATPEAMALAGYGRLDALGFLLNELCAVELGQPDNARPTEGPAAYGTLWLSPHLSLSGWTGASDNSLPLGLGPLTRNTLQSLGAFAPVDLTVDAEPGYPSSVQFVQIAALESWVGDLRPPRWPEALLGPLDPARVAAGAALYQAHCATCHAVPAEADWEKGIAVTLVPVAELGTDPKLAAVGVNRPAQTGRLEGQKANVLAGEAFGPTAPAMDVLTHILLGALLEHPEESVRAGLIERAKAPSQETRDGVYKAGPLFGVWATPPYLHNGSVPSLAQLLLPPDAREPRWYQGGDDYDPVSVGYVATSAPGNDTLFDASRPGNSNLGHAYGTGLSAEERASLLEYLKSL